MPSLDVASPASAHSSQTPVSLTTRFSGSAYASTFVLENFLAGILSANMMSISSNVRPYDESQSVNIPNYQITDILKGSPFTLVSGSRKKVQMKVKRDNPA